MKSTTEEHRVASRFPVLLLVLNSIGLFVSIMSVVAYHSRLLSEIETYVLGGLALQWSALLLFITIVASASFSRGLSVPGGTLRLLAVAAPSCANIGYSVPLFNVFQSWVDKGWSYEFVYYADSMLSAIVIALGVVVCGLVLQTALKPRSR